MHFGETHSRIAKASVFAVTAVAVNIAVFRPEENPNELPNRIPEAPPYVLAEAQAFPPPYEEYWLGQNHVGQCRNCHQKIFDQWNGSMMSNSWRDPVWRAAFLLLSRSVSTNGNCAIPDPPDGTKKARLNPFAKAGACESEFDLGTRTYTMSRSGSLLDGFCSRCHMPTNYVDNVPLSGVRIDPMGLEAARVDPKFDPTSDNGTGHAFATLEGQFRNTESGKTGIFCAVCHSFAATRNTPFHNYERSGTDYQPALGIESRAELVPPELQDIVRVADPAKRSLGYAIGAGSFQLSPHALGFPERLGPLMASPPSEPLDTNTSQVFGQKVAFQHLDSSKHRGFHQAMFVRSEMCGACHDVTNALPIKNALGRWVGGFPIERTYTEWTNSRYADRPGNTNYDPRFKRDCQSCHMQQDYGQPGTAHTLYQDGAPVAVPSEPVATDGPPRPFFTHHFVGGNALVPHLIGKDVDDSGNVASYPELSVFSFSSADHASPYSRALYTHVDRKGGYAQQSRLAWDRLRHVVELQVQAPSTAPAGGSFPLFIKVANTGSGHDFPTGFPEGRIAWLSLHAYDLGTGRELPIRDSFWKRTSLGVGNLTREPLDDPNYPNCHVELPAGSVDPYAMQFKAVASLGDGCPTLDLPFATPLNLLTNGDGLPVDRNGSVIDAAQNPTGLPQFRDLNGNGDLFDDSFLSDTRFKPMPQRDATKNIDRYAVVAPPEARGPIAVSVAVYYQSLEAVVAAKFLGNLVDTDNDLTLEPCVLGGLCDGRTSKSEPAAVEGAPPVPMIAKSAVVRLDGQAADTTAPRFAVYPAPGARVVYTDAVPKVFFSEPVSGVDADSFTLIDAQGAPVAAWVDPVGDGAWGLFPNRVLLARGETYTARVKAGICDFAGNCTPNDITWKFTVAAHAEEEAGDTTIPAGFAASAPQLDCQASTPAKSAREKRHERGRPHRAKHRAAPAAAPPVCEAQAVQASFSTSQLDDRRAAR